MKIQIYRFLSVYHNYNLSTEQKILIPTDFSTKHITTYYYTSSEKLSQSILKNRSRISDILSINSFSLANIILVRYPIPSGVSFTTLIITSKANAQTTFLLKKPRRDIFSSKPLYFIIEYFLLLYFLMVTMLFSLKSYLLNTGYYM